MTWNYSYPMRLRLVCPTIDLQQSPYNGILAEAVKEFNDRSETAFNPKRIRDLQHLGNSEISLVLDSRMDLESPGKALRLFSQVIAGHEAFAPAIQKGRLFLTLPTVPGVANLEEVVATAVSPEKISDEALLNGLIHFFLNKAAGSTSSEYKKKRAAVELMKSMALNAGLIDIETLTQQEEKKNEAK